MNKNTLYYFCNFSVCLKLSLNKGQKKKGKASSQDKHTVLASLSIISKLQLNKLQKYHH